MYSSYVIIAITLCTVSYTHLDVYKRQVIILSLSLSHSFPLGRKQVIQVAIANPNGSLLNFKQNPVIIHLPKGDFLNI